MTIDEAEGDASWCIPDAVKRQAGMRNHCKGQWQHYMIRLGAYYIHGQYVILYHAVHISYTYICDVIGWKSEITNTKINLISWLRSSWSFFFLFSLLLLVSSLWLWLWSDYRRHRFCSAYSRFVEAAEHLEQAVSRCTEPRIWMNLPHFEI